MRIKKRSEERWKGRKSEITREEQKKKKEEAKKTGKRETGKRTEKESEQI